MNKISKKIHSKIEKEWIFLEFYMLGKKEKNKKVLEQKIDFLTEILEKSNLRELIYILGNRREIIIRNIVARNFKRSWNRNSE